MSSKHEGLLWILVVIALGLGIYSVVNLPKEKEEVAMMNKTGYVDIPVLFQEFEMKQELQGKLEKDLLSKKTVLDSLMFQLQTLNNELEHQEKPTQEDILKFQQLQSYYMQQKEITDNYTLDLTQKYDTQILTQMTQYVKDFGVENGYDYIFGASSDGSIMYAPEPNNVTKEVANYINKKYQGKI